METLIIIGLVILGIILLIGIIRVLFAPYTGFVNLLMEVMLLDWLSDGLTKVIDSIVDIWND